MMGNKIKNASWKTTVGGILGGVLLVVGELCDLLGVHAGTITNGEFNAETLLAGLAVLGIGIFARDNDKSSEDVGADKNK